MKTHLSGPILRLVKTTPRLTRCGLDVIARLLSTRKPHWLLRRIASEVNYRVPVDVRLGNGMKIRVVWVDVVGREICTRGYYEPGTVKVIREFLKPGMVFIDLGAQVGQYTLLAAGLGATVHSFEPDTETFRLLRHNVSANGLANVRVNPCAVAERCKRAIFYSGKSDNIGVSSLRQSEDSSVTYEVECVSLDAYVERSHIPRVDLVKIDVEGAELEVLQGARKLLGGPGKPHLIVEFCENNQAAFDSSSAKLEESFRSLGYELFRIEGSGLTRYRPRVPEEEYFNVLAVPEISGIGIHP